MSFYQRLLPVFFLLAATEGLDPSQCIAPLGMEHGTIKDEDITASSSFDRKNVGPHHGRIRAELNGGAWCPQTSATPDLKEWLQIDLHEVHMITGTGTQGRFGNGQGVEYAEAYVLEYWRPKLSKWIRYRNTENNEVLKGNMNTYLESKTELNPPIWASKIRFLPFSYHKRTVCMRVEVYGCKWSDGVVSYSMPQGDRRGSSWEFYDTCYDGHWDGEKLRYGLGQLVDGRIGPDDFKYMFYSYKDNTQGWVGWKNDSRGEGPVEITFEFDKVREFTAVHIYCNNQFAKDVQVFSQARVLFSVGGKYYAGKPIVFDYIEDRIFENPRNITVKLHHRIGQFVKLQLFFAARWMLISEVTFDSTVINGNFTEEEDQEQSDILLRGSDPSQTEHNIISALNTPSGLGQYIGIGVGLIAVVAVVAIGGVSFVLIQQRKYKGPPRASQIPNGCDKAALYGEHNTSKYAGGSEYGIDRDSEYAVPLQCPQSPRLQPTIDQSFFPKPPPVPPPPEKYYAATEICGRDFVPPPPPLTTPPPVRFNRPTKYLTNTKTYVGP